MNLDFYGLSDKPFELTPDLTFLYLTRNYKRAVENVITAIHEKRGLIVIMGEVGTGKTMLIHGVMARLSQNIKKAFIFHSNYEFKDLIQQILFELGKSTSFEETQEIKKTFLDYLEKMRERGELLTVLIDEAHLLPIGVVDHLLNLFEGNPWISETLQLVLVGQPELDERYVEAFLKNRLTKPPLKVKTKPLSADESVDYIEHRLRIAGKSSAEIFSPQAISLIVEKAEGILRVINNICDNALYIGYNASVKVIGAEIIQKVIRNLEGPDYMPATQTKYSWNAAFRYIFCKRHQYPRSQMQLQLQLQQSNRIGRSF